MSVMPSSRERWVPIPGSEHASSSGVPSRRTASDRPIEITVRVRARESARRHRRPSRPLTRPEFEKVWSADPRHLAKVTTFARRHGLRVVEADAARRSVVLSGPPAALQKAFKIRLTHHRGPAGTFHIVTGKVSVPETLRSVIEGVIGLDTRAPAGPAFRHSQRLGTPKPTYPSAKLFTPADIAHLYRFPRHVTGRGQCIGLIEFGGGYRTGDVHFFCRRLGIPVPEITAVPVDGTGNHPTVPARDQEVMLDIEVACAAAPGAKIAVYFAPAPMTARSLLHALITALHDAVNRPSVISISWGLVEGTWSKNEMDVINGALEEAAALGVTVCCASGDRGSSSGTGEGLHVNFPASSPYVLACGGTRVHSSGGRITREEVWSDGHGASGGGVSIIFPLPEWQENAKVRPRPGSGRVVGRALPDVAGSASPATGYHVRVDGTWLPHLAGTSAVAPLWAGLIARINQHVRRPVGYLTPLLYELDGRLARAGCKDITTGSNGTRYYKAGRGWDACTGWGRPIGTKLMEALEKA